jgi:hypothetical protein
MIYSATAEIAFVTAATAPRGLIVTSARSG